MNNISGFSQALPATQFATSEPIKGHDPATPGKQPNAFGDVLAGLSQQNDRQQAPSSGLKSGAWKALANEAFSNGDKGSDSRSSFDASGASLDDAAADGKSAPLHALLQNPAQLPLPAPPAKAANTDSQLPSGSAKIGNAGLPEQTQSLSGRTIGNATASLISRSTSAEDVADVSAESADPTHKTPDNTKTFSGVASKGNAPSASVSQPPAKAAANAQTPKVPVARPQQTATAPADTESAAEPVSLVSAAMSDANSRTGQTSASSSSANADRRRRTESDSAQPPAAPNLDAQVAAAAMAMTNAAGAAFASAPNAESQTAATATHGLPGAEVDPAQATLSALDAEPEQKAHEELGAPIKLDSVSQTTHFAPVAWLSPTQQVFNAVSAALPSQSTSEAESGASSPTASASSASLNSLAVTSQPSSVSLKTLDLQLDPQNLGAVSIKLNLSAAGLTVEVQASQAKTAELLEKDKRTLTDGLNGAGYIVSGVEISSAPSSGIAGFTDQSLAQNSSGQSWGGDSQTNGGSQTQSGGNDSFSRQNPNQDRHGNPETTRSAAQRSAGSGLYI